MFNTDNNQPHFDQYWATHNKNKEQEKTTKEACNTYNENQQDNNKSQTKYRN